MRKLLAVLLVVIMVLAGCSNSASPSPSATTPVSTSSPVTTLPATTVPPTTTPAITFIPGSLEQRLDLLAQQMAQQRQTLHIPGMALAVVKDDKVVFAKGFGVSDIEKNTPVTPDTIFAIGSTTKAFTSTLVGMLVDEGKMAWSDPVSRYLPYFKMKVMSEDPAAQITLVDALSHRSGFPRMALLTASGHIPREEALQDASAAEPLAAFRSQFYYSNEIYMSAGIAAGQAAGSDWDTLIKTRILQPLGMQNTTTSYAQVAKDSRLSKGYIWDEDTQNYRQLPLRNVDNIGPAGSINSNVMDMAQWLRLQLGNGQYAGQRLISEANLLETRKTYMQIAQGVDYGLGWMLRNWQGHQVIEHGGNVDGFSAEVAFIPDSHLGYVLLTNASVNALPSLSLNMVWETLLGDWKTINPDSPQSDFQPYLGKYIANFANFKNTTFTVLVQNNRLAVDIPGQMTFELKSPDAQGKWYFAVTDQIAVSFDKNAQGQVTGMKMYQSGLTFDIPKEGFEQKPEIPLADLQKYMGTYNSNLLGTVTVLIQNNHLSLDIPNQMVYELFPPDAEGRWYFRVTNQISVKFNTAADGSIDSLTMYQGGLEFLMPRGQNQVTLPSVEEILNLRHTDQQKAALKKLGNFRLDATVYIAQCGIHGNTSIYVAGDGKYRINEDYGKYGSAVTAINGNQAWVKSSFAPFQELHGKLLEQAQQGYPETFMGDWRDFFDSIQVLRADSLNGRPVYVLELQNGSLPAMTIYVDSKTGDVLRSDSLSVQDGGISISISTSYEDFREVQGLRFAFREISSNNESGRAVIEYQKLESNINIDSNYFILTPDPQ